LSFTSVQALRSLYISLVKNQLEYCIAILNHYNIQDDNAIL